MISLQTNTTSLMAQQNLNADNAFQSKTIQELTSGYRINSSGDDAAGLAIANGYRSSVAELTQGVANANDGTSQLQIIDGGLSNISTILDRMKTLATQSASSTFTGSRATLNQEYAGLITEVNRQAANINLNAGGTFNTNLSVYIGGAGTNQANASINIDLSGAANAVDATSLGIASTNVLGGGVGITGNTQRIDGPGDTFVKGTAGTDDQSFTFHVFSGGNATTVTATVAASTNGSSLSSVLSSLNGQLNSYGITAGTDSNGTLQFSGAAAFTVADNGSISGNGTSLLTNDQVMAGQTTYSAAAQTLTLTNASGTVANVNLSGSDTLAQALTKINAQTSSTGISAVTNAAGTGINFVGASGFSVSSSITTASVFSGGTGVILGQTSSGGGTSGDTYVITNAANSFATVTLGGSDTTNAALISDINGQLKTAGVTGVTAVANKYGTGVNFVGSGAFTVSGTESSASAGVFNSQSPSATATVTTGNPPAIASGTGVIYGQVANLGGTAGDTLAFTNAAGQSATVTLGTDNSNAAMIADINTQLKIAGFTGVSAQANQYGTGVNFVGPGAISVTQVATTANKAAFNSTTSTNYAATVSSGTSENTANYTVDGASTFTTPGALNKETMQFETSAGSATVTIKAGDTLAATIANINAQTASLGVSAILNGTGTGISLQGANSFSVNDLITTIAGGTPGAAAAGVFAAPAVAGASTNITATAPPAGSAATNNGTAAITAIDAAITNLGLVQGSIGAGENKLQYASNLAQSQITSYSAAESQIRDTDVAAQAANLTKAQVLVQTSVAALAQANSAPQSILKLLQ